MRRNRRTPYFEILMVIFVILSQSWIIWAILQQSRDTLTLLGWISGATIPAIILVFNIFKSRSTRFFIFVNQIRSLLSDSTPRWELKAQWQGVAIAPNTLEKLVDSFRTYTANGIKTTVTKSDASTYLIFISPGPILEITYSKPTPSVVEVGAEDNPPYIYARIRNYNVSFRRAAHAIRKEILPVIERVNSVIGTSEVRYSLSIEFDKSQNPFFGLYLSQLPEEVVSKFIVRLNVSDYQSKDEVLISETKILINTQSQNALQHLALEFLSLDYNLSRRL